MVEQVIRQPIERTDAFGSSVFEADEFRSVPTRNFAFNFVKSPMRIKPLKNLFRAARATFKDTRSNYRPDKIAQATGKEGNTAYRKAG